MVIFITAFWELTRSVFRTVTVSLCLLSLVVLSGCGGTGNSQTDVVSTVPTAVSIPVSGTETFTAIVSGEIYQGVTWTVEEGTTGGTVTSAGVYTAPATAGTYHIVAASVANPLKSVTAIVTVTAASTSTSISLSPSSVTLVTTATQAFTAAVAGATDTSVTWTVEEGATGGAVTMAGIYTTPATAGTYHVIATSTADSAKTATATITVMAP